MYVIGMYLGITSPAAAALLADGAGVVEQAVRRPGIPTTAAPVAIRPRNRRRSTAWSPSRPKVGVAFICVPSLPCGDRVEAVRRRDSMSLPRARQDLTVIDRHLPQTGPSSTMNAAHCPPAA